MPNTPKVALIASAVTAALLLMPDSASAQFRISEIFFNPPGTDAPNEYIELRGTAGSTFAAGTYLVNVEGDSNGGPGDVNSFFDLSGRTFGSNGFLTLLQKGNTYSPNSSATNLTNTGSGAGYGSGAGSSVGFNADNSGTDFENPAHTIFLITTATAPTLTTDIDGNNDGTADGSAFGTWSILDSVGVVDGGASDTAYGAINFLRNGAGLTPAGANNITTSFTGEYVGRIGDSFGSTASDWVAGDIGGVNPTDFAFANASNSAYVGQLLSQMQLGSFNAVPEPGTMALLGVGVLPLYGAMRSRKKAAKRG